MKSAVLAVVFLTALWARAEAADLYVEPAPQPTPAQVVEKRWEFVIVPYLLAPTIQGNSRIGRLPTTDLDVSPGTILENLKFGAMGHFEVLYDNRFGATFDVAYMDLGSSRTFPAVGGSVSAGVKQLVSEAFFGYRFYRVPRAWAEVYAGGR